MDKIRLLMLVLFFFIFLSKVYARETDEFTRLQLAYPETIKEVTNSYIGWTDGKRMLIRHFPLIDYIIASANNVDLSIGSISRDDIKRDSYEVFFRKMYGNSPEEVR